MIGTYDLKQLWVSIMHISPTHWQNLQFCWDINYYRLGDTWKTIFSAFFPWCGTPHFVSFNVLRRSNSHQNERWCWCKFNAPRSFVLSLIHSVLGLIPTGYGQTRLDFFEGSRSRQLVNWISHRLILQYDYSVTTFSPDGRVFQVEYAEKAAEKAK